jgi:hypothetical protein
MPQPGLVWEDADDRKILAASGLRLIFTRTADRWTHTLELEGAVLAESLETDADRSDSSTVVSPAYQEIQPHSLGDQPDSPLCVLLTGKLFDHHFSAAVTFTITSDRPSGVVVDWDVADRCRSPISYLAATYQTLLGPGDLADAGPHAIRWSGDRLGQGSLDLLAGPPENLALAEAGRTGTRVQAVAKVEGSAFTHRLRYRWRWSRGIDVAS